jgi:hypothetical protein
MEIKDETRIQDRAFAEECKKALEKSYGFEIPMPKNIAKRGTR